MAHRVEILGMFGSGKTTLASRLLSEGIELLAERHQDIPYWGDESSSSRIGFLGHDLSFLLQHVHLCIEGDPSARKLAICDWSFVSDRLWASMRLASDFPLYRPILETLAGRISSPIGYLYLKQTTETVVERLSKRGRPAERRLLSSIGDAVRKLEEEVAKLDDARVVVVNDFYDVNQLKNQVARWTKESARG